MSRPINLLTANEVKHKKPLDKVRRYSDGGGLLLTVQPNGSKLWHFRYKVDGKNQMASFGMYPDVSLKKARDKAEDARKDLTDGITPKDRARLDEQEKRKERIQHDSTFEAVARAWYTYTCSLEGENQPWTNDKHRDQTINTLEAYAFPKLGSLPIAEVTAKDIRRVIDSMKNAGKWETAARVFQRIGMVMDSAIEEEIIENNPCDFLRRQKLFKNRPPKGHFAALEPKELPELMEAIEKAKKPKKAADGYTLKPKTEYAVRLSMMTAARPGELRFMEWDEIDMENRQWIIPGPKMKVTRDHIVPLTDDMIEILHKMEPLTGRNQFVFPHRSKGKEPMCDGAVNSALKRMGFGGRCTAHGFRSIFSTWAHEVLDKNGIAKYRSDVIEMQLAHWEKNKTKAAYNRALYLPEREELMKGWCQYIRECSIPKVTSLSTKRKKKQ